MNRDFTRQFERLGYCVVPTLADHARITSLIGAIETGPVSRVKREGQTYGARNLLRLPDVRAFATSPEIASHLLPLLGRDFLPVRGIFFDKTRTANWPVLWHQDLSVAVCKHRESAGWTNWSVKRGVPHAQPPPEILDRMVTVRLHLDDCPAENGALRVIGGSHRMGVLTREKITAVTSQSGETITAKPGDALFMRPLLLHASASSRMPGHRRVLHLEFAPADLLPEGLEWALA